MSCNIGEIQYSLRFLEIPHGAHHRKPSAKKSVFEFVLSDTAKTKILKKYDTEKRKKFNFLHLKLIF